MAGLIEIDLTAAAYELVRGSVASKSRRNGVHKVLMPTGLVAKLEAERALGESLSGLILRLAEEAKDPRKP
jgi:hypothetical protein